MESYSIYPFGSASFYSAVCEYVETFICLFGCSGSSCCSRAFVVGVSGGSSLVVVCGLLIAVVSLVAEHMALQCAWALVVAAHRLSREQVQYLWLNHGLSCPVACGICPD